MHRFYLPPGDCKSAAFALTGREAHHALHVLRVQRGEPVTIMDGAGSELLCEIQSSTRDTLQLAVVQKKSIPPLPGQITLLQAVPRGKIIETIIQKATELGVTRVVPLLSERVATRLTGDEAAEKAEKWQSIAVEALKQCGAAWLPKIETPIAPDAFLARKEAFDLALIGSLQTGSRHAREYFRAFRQQHGHAPRSIAIWIGPEGDFTSAEIGAAESAGALPITFGSLVLRSETAAVYGLSIVNYELQSPTP